MKFLKNLFNISSIEPEDKLKKQVFNLSLDDAFVHNFIEKGGKFLYCEKKEEVLFNLQAILKENSWDKMICIDPKLTFFVNKIEVIIKNKLVQSLPFFTTCEHLISDNGSILFSSNQLKSNKLAKISNDFIVYATTSQLVKNMGQGLTGIKTNFKRNIPTNISSIRNYSAENIEDNFLNYGDNNSKNLYLLLLEDL